MLQGEFDLSARQRLDNSLRPRRSACHCRRNQTSADDCRPNDFPLMDDLRGIGSRCDRPIITATDAIANTDIAPPERCLRWVTHLIDANRCIGIKVSTIVDTSPLEGYISVNATRNRRLARVAKRQCTGNRKIFHALCCIENR